MTSRGRTLKVDIVGDADSLKREIAAARRAVAEAERELERINGTTDKVTRSSDELGSSFGRQDKIVGSLRAQWLGYTAAIGVGVGAVTGAMYTAKQFVEVARQEEQARARVTQIFEDQTGAIAEWADQADQSIGLSRRAALQAAGDFGNMFDQLGFGREQTVGMSTAIVNLAADYSAFHDADISDVITAQSAAFRGEYDALQRYLPTINAAHVEQKAMQLGLAETTKELTTQDKALATYRIMMEESGKAVGASAREADELTGQQARLNAEIENLQSNIGEALVPAFTVATTALNKFLDENSEEIANGIALGIDGMTEAAEQFKGVLDDIGALDLISIPFEFAVDERTQKVLDLLGQIPGVAGAAGAAAGFGGDLLLDGLTAPIRMLNPATKPIIPGIPDWVPGLGRWDAVSPADIIGGAIDLIPGAGSPPPPGISQTEWDAEITRMQGGITAPTPKITKLGMVSTPPLRGSSVFDLIRQQALDAEEELRRSIRSGGKSDAEVEQEAQLRELERITADFFLKQRDAYRTGGEDAVAEIRETQRQYVQEVTDRAEELSGVLGVSLSEALALARDEAQQLADAEQEHADAMKEQREQLLAEIQRLTGASLTTENEVGLKFRDVLTGFAGGDLTLFEPLVQLAGAGAGASFAGGGSVSGEDIIRALQSGQFAGDPAALAQAVADALASNQNFGVTVNVNLSDDLTVVP